MRSDAKHLTNTYRIKVVCLLRIRRVFVAFAENVSVLILLLLQ